MSFFSWFRNQSQEGNTNRSRKEHIATMKKASIVSFGNNAMDRLEATTHVATDVQKLLINDYLLSVNLKSTEDLPKQSLSLMYTIPDIVALYFSLILQCAYDLLDTSYAGKIQNLCHEDFEFTADDLLEIVEPIFWASSKHIIPLAKSIDPQTKALLLTALNRLNLNAYQSQVKVVVAGIKRSLL